MTKYEKLKLCLSTFFVVGFLLCFYNYSQNGNYVFKNSSTLILNTRTGKLYMNGTEVKQSTEKFKSRRPQ
jgi:hypothetical protein